MAPPARSPAVSNSQSPSIVPSARENYMTSTPHLNRHVPRASPGEAISITQRPPLPANARPYDANSAPPTPSNGKLEPANQLTINDNDGGPPLDRTVLLHQITAPDGQSIEPKINARIDKGFFRADQDWTCYRRNYFAVACSYSLEPPINNFPLTLHRSGSGMSENIFGFAMSISAVVDGANGKAIELIQHTPKRDKGPQGKPDRIKLNPHIPGSVGITPGLGLMANASQAPGQQEYEQAYYPQSSHTLTIANFDRIQFKSATANNGKRRAAQQYYHLIVELFADLGGPAVNPEARWVKVASRMSVPMVVRGRSPGHYQDEKRSSSSSAGPGSGPGSDGRRIVGPRLSTPNGTHISLLNGSPMLGGGGGYQPSGGLASHQHSPAGSSMGGTSLSSTSSTTGQIDNPVEPIISTEEAEAIEGYSAYQYYPSALYDSQLSHSRPAYHSTSYRDERTTGPPYAPFEGENIRAFSGGEIRRLSKDDYTPQHPGLPLSNQWNPTGPASKDVGRGEILSRSCGRFEGAESSRGHFPDLSPVNY
ncbi:MAG: hypothetical protein M1829_002095 [Trizodia sp. TS-e1964]|nr:MAG: hypothetical protein M1829_002095 [Trizodia sp. TS-e1964]